jgi:hypothetical protein
LLHNPAEIPCKSNLGEPWPGLLICVNRAGSGRFRF